MPFNNRQDYIIIDLIQQAVRNIKAQPMNLGGFSGEGGGTGRPPGGFIGQLIQTAVAYDYTEAATLDTSISGSLVDNLNHIRYRIGQLELTSGIIVTDDNTPITYDPTTHIHFSGAGVIVTDLGGGEVRVTIGSGGSGAALTVQEQDGSPIVTNVDKIIFSGATVTDLGSGDVLVAIASGGGSSALTVKDYDSSPTVSNVDTIIFSGMDVTDMGSGDVMISIPPERQGVAVHHTYYPIHDTFFHDVGSYYYMTKTPGSDASVSSGALTGETEFGVTITPPGSPGAVTFGEGVNVVYIRARRLSGTKNVKIFCKLYSRTSGGTETLRMTSVETPNLTGSYAEYKLVLQGGPFYLASSDRLVLKFYATPYDSGTNPTAQISCGNSASYTRLQLSSATEEAPVIAETNTNDIFRVNSSGSSSFAAQINGTPSGTSVVYDTVTGNENALVPASTSQLAKLVLYNTTRGDSALISNCNTATNTITLTATVPGTWADNDVITIASQTVSGGTGNWVDLKIVNDLVGKSLILAHVQVTGGTVAATTMARIHPFEAFGSPKIQALVPQVATFPLGLTVIIKPITDTFTVSWITGGAADFTFVIREIAYII